MKEQKDRLIEERKTSAMLQAQLDELKKTESKLDTIETYANEQNTKLLLKEEEIKKMFFNMQNMKTTISELEEGIYTYQSYAEEKSEALSEMQAKKEEI